MNSLIDKKYKLKKQWIILIFIETKIKISNDKPIWFSNWMKKKNHIYDIFKEIKIQKLIPDFWLEYDPFFQNSYKNSN